MATLVVTVERAALFADSRYWVQAEAELAGTGIELVKIATGASADHIHWLARETPRGAGPVETSRRPAARRRGSRRA